MSPDAAEPPFRRAGPESPASPVVLSVPHSGRAYTPALLAAARLSRTVLAQLEDPFVDGLVRRAIGEGASALIAQAPRAEIDLNRDEREIDAAMIDPPPPIAAIVSSERTRGGLGLIPSRIGGAGAVWARRIAADELARRIETIHRPYHATLDAMLRAARDRFGVAILLDCHSMPPQGRNAGLVFGDRHGTSIAPRHVRAAIGAAEGAGFRCVRNIPYAGGYLTARHGRPAHDIHALQIEIDRSLYLDHALHAPGPGFERTAKMVAAVAAALAASAIERPEVIAAE